MKVIKLHYSLRYNSMNPFVVAIRPVTLAEDRNFAFYLGGNPFSLVLSYVTGLGKRIVRWDKIATLNVN
jgi:hypothetical protein